MAKRSNKNPHIDDANQGNQGKQKPFNNQGNSGNGGGYRWNNSSNSESDRYKQPKYQTADDTRQHNETELYANNTTVILPEDKNKHEKTKNTIKRAVDQITKETDANQGQKQLKKQTTLIGVVGSASNESLLKRQIKRENAREIAYQDEYKKFEEFSSRGYTKDVFKNLSVKDRETFKKFGTINGTVLVDRKKFESTEAFEGFNKKMLKIAKGQSSKSDAIDQLAKAKGKRKRAVKYLQDQAEEGTDYQSGKGQVKNVERATKTSLKGANHAIGAVGKVPHSAAIAYHKVGYAKNKITGNQLKQKLHKTKEMKHVKRRKSIKDRIKKNDRFISSPTRAINDKAKKALSNKIKKSKAYKKFINKKGNKFLKKIAAHNPITFLFKAPLKVFSFIGQIKMMIIGLCGAIVWHYVQILIAFWLVSMVPSLIMQPVTYAVDTVTGAVDKVGDWFEDATSTEENYKSMQDIVDKITDSGTRYLRMMKDGGEVDLPNDLLGDLLGISDTVKANRKQAYLSSLKDLHGTTQINGKQISDKNYLNTIGGINNIDTSTIAADRKAIGVFKHKDLVLKPENIGRKVDDMSVWDNIKGALNPNQKTLDIKGTKYVVDCDADGKYTYKRDDGGRDIIFNFSGNPNSDGDYTFKNINIAFGDKNPAYKEDNYVAKPREVDGTWEITSLRTVQEVIAPLNVTGDTDGQGLVQISENGQNLASVGAKKEAVNPNVRFNYIDGKGSTVYTLDDEDDNGNPVTRQYSNETYCRNLLSMACVFCQNENSDKILNDYGKYAMRLYAKQMSHGSYNLKIASKDTGQKITWIDKASGKKIVSQTTAHRTEITLGFYLKSDLISMGKADGTTDKEAHEDYKHIEAYKEKDKESEDYVKWIGWKSNKETYEESDRLNQARMMSENDDAWTKIKFKDPNTEILQDMYTNFGNGDYGPNTPVKPGRSEADVKRILDTWEFNGRKLDANAKGAIMGNFYGESSMDCSVNNKYGMGICSWYSQDRRNRLVAFTNGDWQNPDKQLAYLKWEIETKYPQLIDALMSNNTVEWKTGAFAHIFEGCSEISAARVQQGGSYTAADGAVINVGRYALNPYNGKYTVDLARRINAARQYASAFSS